MSDGRQDVVAAASQENEALALGDTADYLAPMRFSAVVLFATTLSCTGPSLPPEAPPPQSKRADSKVEAPLFAADNPEAFTLWAKTELQQRLQNWSILQGDEPLLLILRSGEQELEIWLGRPFEYCATGANDCEQNARSFVDTVVHAANNSQDTPPVSPEQLLPAIRSKSDVETYSSRVKGLVVDPLGADLFVVYMLDTPKLAAPVSSESIVELQLSEEKLKGRALANLQAQLPTPVELIQTFDGQSIGVVELGNYYTSSLLVPHSAWAEVATRFDGKLLVAVPAPEILLFASDVDPQALPTLTEAAMKLFEQAPRGLSPTVLRWTPGGWISAN